MVHKIAITTFNSLLFLYVVFGWILNRYHDRNDEHTFRSVIYAARHAYHYFFPMVIFSRELFTYGWIGKYSSFLSTGFFLAMACCFLYRFYERYDLQEAQPQALKASLVFLTGIALNALLAFPPEFAYYPAGFYLLTMIAVVHQHGKNT